MSAFPHAEEDECCALKPPDEWFESFVPPDEGYDPYDYVWMLLKSLYGRRTAAGNWDKFLEKTLKEICPTIARCEKEPCLYYDQATKMVLLQHLDDLSFVGP